MGKRKSLKANVLDAWSSEAVQTGGMSNPRGLVQSMH